MAKRVLAASVYDHLLMSKCGSATLLIPPRGAAGKAGLGALSAASGSATPADTAASSATAWPALGLAAALSLRPDTRITGFGLMRELRVAWLRDAPGNGVRWLASQGVAWRAQAWLIRRVGASQTRLGAVLTPEDFDALVAHWERETPALTTRDQDGDSAHAEAQDDGRERLSMGAIESTDDATIRLVNSTLLDALNAGASDIHLESVAGGMAVKFRLDGVLVAMARVAGTEATERVISRIKVMAELDIAERRIPQDGRLKLAAAGRDIDVRVSIMPSIHGEDAVLRILDRQALVAQMRSLTVEGLGFDRALTQQLLPLFRLPYGMVLITGPTGSGKTTTLYAAISQTRDAREKIVTIEDPVEYQLDGVLQIPVNERKGLSFASGLRSILRHDPDRILVGEIRDAETARIAVQAALTGHLVMTTIHANNALDVLSRFKQFGIDPYDVVSALVGVVAQRLVRKLCGHCAVADDLPAQQRLREACGDAPAAPLQLRRPMGCAHCRGTGYRGRMAVGELVIFDKRLRRELLALPNPAAADEGTLTPGLQRLHDKALAAAWSGQTSLEEAYRVTMAQ